MRTNQILDDRSLATPDLVPPDISVIVVSFNTQEILRKCLQHLNCALEGLAAEVVVVDNNSRDGSAEMVAREFPWARLLRSSVNLGFSGANNLALRNARGRYLVLLNSDAFITKDGMRLALNHMNANRDVGAGGARLVGEDGSWQPSNRLFPSVLNDLLIYSGLAGRFPKSRFLGRADGTWLDPGLPADTDWVPGAFSILRKEALDGAGLFDESFFLYYEEVDLCRRIKYAGYRVRYFPDVVVVHLGGESSKKLNDLGLSSAGKQLILWRLRSEFLYYRKHHGRRAHLAMTSELLWHRLRWMRNIVRGESGRAQASESRSIIILIQQAWRETRGGRFSPPRPW